MSITATRAHIGIAFCAFLFLLQAGFSARQKSLTWDEPTFIVSGLSYLHTGELTLNTEAPPLPQFLAALPLLLLDLHPPDYASDDFTPRTQVRFASAFFTANPDRVDVIATLSRIPFWLAGAMIVWLIGSFAMRLMGPSAGVSSAIVASLSPNLIAHGRLATSDALGALGMLAAVYAIHIVVRHPHWKGWMGAGALGATAVLAKFTALLLGPITAILLLVEVRRRTVSRRQLLHAVAPFLAGALAVLTVGYLGEPWLIFKGLSRIYQNTTPGYQFYLLGQVYDHPVWYYYLAAAAIKTPLPTLVLLATGVWILRDRGEARDVLLYCAVPFTILMVVTAFDQANLGLRRILPAYPFAFVFLGVTGLAGACRPCRHLHRALLVGCALVAVSIYPNHLTYFNVMAGGPSRGPYLMDDSNVDWGQNFPALSAWQRTHHTHEPLKLFYFGTLPPELYGIDHTPIPNNEIVSPQPGVYAVSAHQLVYIRKTACLAGADVDWLDRFEPFDRLGGSIYLYRFPQ